MSARKWNDPEEEPRMADLLLERDAVISDCKKYRYLLVKVIPEHWLEEPYLLL